MENQPNNLAARVFAGAFADSLAESLGKAIGTPWRLAVLESPELETRHGQTVHFRLTVSGSINGECFVEFYQPQITELASKILGHAPSTFADEHKRALEKLISATMAKVASSLSATCGEFTCKVQHVEDLAFGGMFVVPLAASEGDEPDTSVLLYFDGQLLSTLSSSQSTKETAKVENNSVDALNLKLVMDVELNVSLRFGQRQLPLREVLELASGSVVELDRQVDDPVELLLDGKVIARGEAVIVDGNYGLRVTEIPQPITSHFIR
jgi:flagellar motor switch protein FliN/FliY